MIRSGKTFSSASSIPRLRPLEETRIESMIRSNLVQDIVAQLIVAVVCVLWFSHLWIWVLWGVRWVVVVAIVFALRASQQGLVSRALLLFAAGHVVGVVGLVAVVPLFVPLAMLILVGDLFIGSYLDETVRTRFFVVMVAVVGSVAALSFQSWTDLADRTPRNVAITFICAHTFGSGFLIPRARRQHYLLLARSRDRLQASEQRISIAMQVERAGIATALEEAPIASITALGAKLRLIRRDRTADPVAAAALADAAATETQEALRSLRQIAHGVYPESLQSGLGDTLLPLLGRLGVVDRFEVPQHRLPTSVEAAVYMAVREIAAVGRDKVTSITVVIEAEANRLHFCIRLNGIDADSVASLSPMASDRISAAGGESIAQLNGTTFEFLANIPCADIDPRPTLAGGDLRVDEFDANVSILRVFTTSGFRVAALSVLASAVVLATTRQLSGVYVVATLTLLAAGALAGSSLARRGKYGASVLAMCVATSVTAVLATALVTELSSAMSLVVCLPMTLAVPFLSERHLDQIAFLQAGSLSAVAVIAYLDAPLIERVVANIVPATVVPLASCAAAGFIVLTLVGTVRAVTDASTQVMSGLSAIVQAGDAHRHSIERDLHDGAQQSFVAISMQFRTLAKLISTDTVRASKVIDTTEHLLEQTRVGLLNLARGALVPELDQGRLADALRRGVALFDQTVHLSAVGVDFVSSDVANAVYFCCHEALQNAVKHGGSDVIVTVSVAAVGSEVHFSVADDGVGFDPHRTQRGSGLDSIGARVSEGGGELCVTSSLGRGTVVAGTFPVGVG
jgi:signal transduction histidine kinase